MTEPHRQTLVCPNPKCLLVQYETASGKCRKCHGLLRLPPPPVLPPEDVQPESPLSRLPAREFHVARNIRRIRRVSHLSQRGLAIIMNCPRSYISKLESGVCIPTLQSIERVSRALGVKPSDLIADGTEWVSELIPYIPHLTERQLAEVLYKAATLSEQAANLSRKPLSI